MAHGEDHIALALADEAATLSLGGRLAAGLEPGLKVWLRGDLGAGKTTLVRGLLRRMGYVGKVKSPTYTLVEPYTVAGLHLHHFDLYRLVDPEEWNAAGFRDHFNAQSVCLVEWPERAEELLPMADLEISLTLDGAGRKAVLLAWTEAGKRCLERLSRCC